MIRIGQGYDVHRLVPGRELILCGVHIPHPTGLLGHSDADVACHALMDAIAGALALGDIGQFFPNSDPAYRNADSLQLLARVMELPELRSWQLVNCDLTIVAQKPKLMPHRLEMRNNLAAQVAGSVRWEECVRAMVAAGGDTMIEFGPGNVLTGLLRRTLPEIRGINVNSVETLDAIEL